MFGDSEETGNDAVYIGEAEQVASRVQQHLLGKDFWNEVVCFTNKDENLTKAHVKYLESRLVELTKQAKRYELDNGNQTPQTTLPRGDKDVMEEFIANVRILIGALGFKLLEPLVSSKNISEPTQDQHVEDDTFTLKAKKFSAFAKQTNEGIVVLSGSQASTTANASLSNGYTKVRAALIEKGKMFAQDGKLVLTEDVLFASPSQAAAVLLGYPCSGPDYWLDENGVSLKQRESVTF